jgi:hypothetical protein
MEKVREREGQGERSGNRGRGKDKELVEKLRKRILLKKKKLDFLIEGENQGSYKCRTSLWHRWV